MSPSLSLAFDGTDRETTQVKLEGRVCRGLRRRMQEKDEG